MSDTGVKTQQTETASTASKVLFIKSSAVKRSFGRGRVKARPGSGYHDTPIVGAWAAIGGLVESDREAGTDTPRAGQHAKDHGGARDMSTREMDIDKSLKLDEAIGGEPPRRETRSHPQGTFLFCFLVFFSRDLQLAR